MQAYRQKAEPQEIFYCKLQVFWSTWFTLNCQMVPLHPKSKVCQNKLYRDILWCFRKEKEHCSLFSRMQSLSHYPWTDREKKLCEETEHTVWLSSAFCRQEPSIWSKRKGTLRLPGPGWRALKAHLGHRLCSSLWQWPAVNLAAHFTSMCLNFYLEAAVLILMFPV